ncbi:MAG: ATP-binding protein [Cyclobacteriaceae bacterium]
MNRILQRFLSSYLLLHALLYCTSLHANKDEQTQVLDPNNQIDSLIQWGDREKHSDPAKTISLGYKALEIAKKYRSIPGQVHACRIISVGHWYKGAFQEAMENAIKCYQLSQKHNYLPGEIRALTLMGLISDDQKLFRQAASYYQQAYKLSTSLKDSLNVAKSLNNLGANQLRRNHIHSSLHYFEQAASIHRALDNQVYLADVLNNQGYSYIETRQYDFALKSLNEALEIRQKSGNKIGESIVQQNLGKLYTRQNDFDKANQAFERSLQLAQESGALLRQKEVYHQWTILNENQGNFREALDNYKMYEMLKDSLSNSKNTARIAEMLAAFEEKKRKQEIQNLMLSNKMNTLWQRIFLGLLFLLFIISFLGYRLYRFRNLRNQQLLEMQRIKTEELEALDKLKSRFFANISHDFRTPLSLILAPVEALKDSVSPTVKRQLDVIQRNAAMLLKLVNQLLELSRIESGTMTLKCTSQDIVSLAKGILWSFQATADKKQIQLYFDSECNRIELYFEQEKIEQVLINLIANAIRYTPREGILGVTIRTLRERDKPCLEIQVCDSGPGISKDKLPRIFDRFFQGDSASHEYDGVGIGLSIAKEFVELHHGHIHVNSTVGKGSTFCVQLPMEKYHLNPDQIADNITASLPIQASGLEKQTPMGPVSFQGKRILLVEDNPDFRKYLADQLKSNYQVLVAENGKLGLEKSIKCIPDLIISDVVMPEMDGITFCQHLKEDPLTDHIPIILLTAEDNPNTRISGLQSLADDFLVKPFQINELTTRIQNLISIREKLKEKNRSLMLQPGKVREDSMDQAFLKQLLEVMEGELQNEYFGVEKLSAELGMSRVHLHRKLLALIGKPPSQFIRSFRLQRAYDLLAQNTGTVAEVAYRVGFSSLAYFTKCFHETYGFTPTDLKAHRGKGQDTLSECA